MQKRGQATIFIIIGVVVIILVMLVVFLKGEITLKPLSAEAKQNFLSSKLEPIRNHVKECITDLGASYVKALSLSGGDVNPSSFVFYKGNDVQYLCYRDGGTGSCVQNILTRKNMESEINSYLDGSLPGCINLDSFRDGRYDISAGSIDADSEINDNNIFVSLNYPVKLISGDVKAEIDSFSEVINLPLGKLHDLSIDILNDEVSDIYCDNVGYMVDNKGEVLVERHKPYPDTVYVLTHKDSGLVFQFGVEGIERV